MRTCALCLAIDWLLELALKTIVSCMLQTWPGNYRNNNHFLILESNPRNPLMVSYFRTTVITPSAHAPRVKNGAISRERTCEARANDVFKVGVSHWRQVDFRSGA